MRTVLPGFLRVPWLATSNPMESGVAYSWIGTAPTTTVRITLCVTGSITATAFSSNSETKTKRPCHVKPTCAALLPVGSCATSLWQAVSLIDTVP
ncbi:MAG: hypothetical protein LH479_00695 [Polaromonas sp.]|nr:hypothetical protein [Polaromonas sp.]